MLICAKITSMAKKGIEPNLDYDPITELQGIRLSQRNDHDTPFLPGESIRSCLSWRNLWHMNVSSYCTEVYLICLRHYVREKMC